MFPLPRLVQGVPGALGCPEGLPWDHPLFLQGLGSGPPCVLTPAPLSPRVSWSSFGVGGVTSLDPTPTP